MSIINARIRSNFQIVTDWVNQNPTLLSREIAWGVDNDGLINLRIGNGTQSYNQLTNYLIFDGDYNKLTNTPNNLSDFINDTGFITGISNINQIPNRSYNDLQNLPTLFDGQYSSLTGSPNNLSDFINDTGFITGISNINQIPNRSYNDLQNLPTLFDKFTIEIDGGSPLDIENQDVVNFISGNNVTITRNLNDITISSSGGTGSINNITEIPNRSYNDLQDLPTNLSFFTNDLSFITLSDVSNNADVIANTSARHNAVTLSGLNYITLSNQQITANSIDLQNHVINKLSFNNLPTGNARSVIGRAGATNGDVSNIDAGNNTILSREGTGNLAFNDSATIKTMLSIENVDNTSDADKPISNATQIALDSKENAGLNTFALGNINGAVTINLSQGRKFTGNLTDDITLSFDNVPTGGAGIILEFTGIEQITWPIGANAVDGIIPEATGGRYKYILTVRSANDFDVDGLIDKIEAVV